MSTSFNLNDQEKKYYSKFLDREIITDTDEFFQEILLIANKKGWNYQDLEVFSALMHNDMGYFCHSLFMFKFKHPLYEKYYGHKNFAPTVSEEDMRIVIDKMRMGIFTPEDLEKFAFKS